MQFAVQKILHFGRECHVNQIMFFSYLANVNIEHYICKKMFTDNVFCKYYMFRLVLLVRYRKYSVHGQIYEFWCWLLVWDATWILVYCQTLNTPIRLPGLLSLMNHFLLSHQMLQLKIKWMSFIGDLFDIDNDILAGHTLIARGGLLKYH